MDWLKDISIEKLIIFSIFVLIIVFVLLFSIKNFLSNGLIESIKTKNGEIRLSVAKKEVETVTRDIIRRDIESVERYLQCFCYEVEALPEVRECIYDYNFKYVVEKMYDLAIKWIIFNSVSLNEDYVALKKNEMWDCYKNTVSFLELYKMAKGVKETTQDFLSLDWKKKINQVVDDIIIICMSNKKISLEG